LWEDVNEETWYLVGEPISLVQHLTNHLTTESRTPDESTGIFDEPDPDDAEIDDRCVMVCVDEHDII
jgi:hypothetical protein